MNSRSNRNLWVGTMAGAAAGALISACGPQDGGNASKTAQAATVATPVVAAAAESPAPAPVMPAPTHAAKHAPAHVDKPVARKPAPAKAEPRPDAVKVAAAPAPDTIGAVQRIDPITEASASGVGAVAGGVLGGVVGNQFGKGDGKKAMTVLGAVGGAVAGHQVEKARNAKVVGYRVQVQLDSGETRTFEPAQVDGLKVGDRVRIEQGRLQRV